MDLKAIAERLVAACRAGEEAELLKALYADDVVSVEAADMGDGRETHGLDGIRGKHAWWNNAFDVHSHSVEGPFLHGDDRFAVIFEVDSSDKATGERSRMREVAIYHVAGEKIVREEFFY